MSTRGTPRPDGYSWLLVALCVLLLSNTFQLTSQAAAHISAATDTLVLLAGVYMIVRRRWVMVVAGALSLPTILGLWLIASTGFRPLWLIVAMHVSLIGLFAFFVAHVLTGVLRARSVTGDTIRGAICAYLLIAIVFAGLYSLVEVLTPEDAFSVHESMLPPTQSMIWFGVDETVGSNELLYFSFTTMTTLGYGDIVPVHSTARKLSSLEAVIGQLYLAILIAHLVGSRLAAGRETEGSDRPTQPSE